MELLDREDDGCIRKSSEDANLESFAHSTNTNDFATNDFANNGIVTKCNKFNFTMNTIQISDKSASSFDFSHLQEQKVSSFKFVADPLNKSTGSTSHDQEHSKIPGKIQTVNGVVVHRNEMEIDDKNYISNKENSVESVPSADGLPAFWNDWTFSGNNEKLINEGKAEADHAGISSNVLDRCITTFIKDLTPAQKKLQVKDNVQLCKTASKRSKVKVHECNYCAESFALLRDFITRNLLAQSIRKKLRCEKCDINFLNVEFFLAHTRTHMGMFAFSCEKCGLLFESQPILQGHIRRNHKLCSKRFSCSVCNKAEFNELKEYEIHLRSHELEDKFNFPCTICSAKFCLRFDFEHHMFTHHQSVSDPKSEVTKNAKC